MKWVGIALELNAMYTSWGLWRVTRIPAWPVRCDDVFLLLDVWVISWFTQQTCVFCRHELVYKAHYIAVSTINLHKPELTWLTQLSIKLAKTGATGAPPGSCDPRGKVSRSELCFWIKPLASDEISLALENGPFLDDKKILNMVTFHTVYSYVGLPEGIWLRKINFHKWGLSWR